MYLLFKTKMTSNTLSNIDILILLLNIPLAQSLAEPSSPKYVSFYDIPGIKGEVYSQPGDINIGDIVSTNLWYNQECHDSFLLSSLIPESTEPIKYAVDVINRDPDLLPNVTLGFHIRGTCGTITMKLATSLSFVPRSERVCNDAICYTKHMKSSDPKWLTHDVIGMLSPEDSEEAQPMANLFSVARVPILGYNSGSNELSRRFCYPFYYRINAHDWYQVYAILKFAYSMGWKYISMVYMDDDHGRDSYRFMHLYAFEYGMVIAASHRMDDYDKVASDIALNRRARAIAVFVKPHQFKILLQKLIDRNVTRHLMWLCSDALTGYNGFTYRGVTEDPAVGAFVFYPTTQFIPGYYDHIRNLDISTTQNPWLKRIWEKFLNCSYDEGTCDVKADILKTRGYRPYKSAAQRMDAVLTFAHTAHNLIQDQCPGARGKEARACLEDGELFLKYLKKVRFQGYNGLIFFNQRWDETEANITISQLTYDKSDDPYAWSVDRRIYERPVAIYAGHTDKLHRLDFEVSWSHLDPVERIVPWTNGSLPIEIPESMCSRPCVTGEYKVIQDVPICWLCLVCRDNERLTEGDTTPCEACPLLMWPDPQSNYTTCIDIPPTYQTVEDTIPLVFFSIAVVALFVTILVIVAYVIYRKEDVIASSSRDLGVIQLIANLIGYTTIILFQTAPTDAMCKVIFYLFCTSFAMLYSPLVVKTTGIYFAVKKSIEDKRVTAVKSVSQIIFALFLIIVQCLLCAAILIMNAPGSNRHQPIRSEKTVELYCDFTLPGLASFLGYNIMLILISAVATFLIGGETETVKELKFISMCVSTTLLIWLVFLPTYFTATREYIRGFLLCMALFLNHSDALLILFVPKIYAAKFSS